LNIVSIPMKLLMYPCFEKIVFSFEHDCMKNRQIE
jgi:hypothetical protein